MTVTPEMFGTATRLRASAIAIIATRDASGAPVGLAASMVLPVSNDPPELLIALNRSAQTCAPLLESGAFTVNLLAEGHQALCRRFASPDQRESRFADPVWTTLATGMPVLADALASFDCRVKSTAQSGTHLLVTGSVANLRVAPDAPAPLIQYQGGYRRLASGAGA